MHNFINLVKSYFSIFEYLFGKNVKNTSEKDIKKSILRGKIQHKRDNDGKLICDGCGLCQKVCPCKDLIQIKCMPIENSKIYVIYERDDSKCIFCGNCIEYCPQKALEYTSEYELAVSDKSHLKAEFKDN